MVPHFGDGVFCLVKFRLLGDCTMVRKKGETLGDSGRRMLPLESLAYLYNAILSDCHCMKGQVVQYGCLWYRWYLDFSYSNDHFLKVNATYMRVLQPIASAHWHYPGHIYSVYPMSIRQERLSIAKCHFCSWSLNYCLGWDGWRILRKQQGCQG